MHPDERRPERRRITADRRARHRSRRRGLGRTVAGVIARTSTPRRHERAHDLGAELSGRSDHQHGHRVQSPAHTRYREPRARASSRSRHRPGADRSAAARVRAAHPRPRRLAREPVRPHHLGNTRRRHVVQPVGHLVGRGARPPTSCALDADGDDRRGLVGRHACRVPAHGAAPHARRRDRHRAQPPVSTRRSSPRCTRCRGWCTRTRASSATSWCSSTSTPASTTRTRGSGSPRRSATRAGSCSRTTARS